MATLIDQGWLYVSNGTDIMKLACVKIKWDYVRNPKITHTEGGYHMGYDLLKKWIVIKVSKILFKTYAHRKTALDTLNSWQDSGPYTLKIQRKSTGQFEEWEGSNTSLSVLSTTGFRDIEKLSNRNQEVYSFGKVIFEQTGATSA